MNKPPVKILSLEIERVKKVAALLLEPNKDGLTIIGGKNRQGKTTAINTVQWLLGGEKFRPSNPKLDGSEGDPFAKLVLNNGLVVSRSGPNSTLKVTATKGLKGGQTLLNELISQLAIDLPSFLEASGKKKAEILLQVIGCGDELKQLDEEEKRLYDQRRDVGKDATRAQNHLESLPVVKDAPPEELSSTELIQQQRAIAEKNAENQRCREKLRQARSSIVEADTAVAKLREDLRQAELGLESSRKYAETLSGYDAIEDESDTEIVAQLSQIDELNKKYRDSVAWRDARHAAMDLQADVNDLSGKLEETRRNRQALLDGAELPLPGLSVIDGELIYNGQKWDCMAESERMRVGVAIARKLKPDCGFVLLDKIEQLDLETLQEFGQWLEAEGLQVIATRVSTGDECSIIIEDGMVKEEETCESQ